MRVSTLRYPLFATVIAMMFLGGWAALQRAGWGLPTIRPNLIGLHGALMIGGVFGALISLERAVALSSLHRSPRHWSFLAPIMAGLGGITLIFLDDATPAKYLLVGGSFTLSLVYAYTATKYHYWSLHTAIMCLGALLWLIGNIFWAAGYPIYSIVHAWLGFIVLTIVGERLELSRVTRLSKNTEYLLIGAIIIYVIGVLLAIFQLDLGVRVTGCGLILLALWLLRYDIASKRLKHTGLTRYIAFCLFIGYLWLGFAGILALTTGAVYAGFNYDAILHAIAGGYIFSMVFGHAPMIFPALTGKQIKFSVAFYVPLALLHLSIILREISNLSATFDGRKWASLLNATSILLFLAMMALGAIRYHRENKK